MQWLHKRRNKNPTGREVAWLTCEFFRISDTDESVLELNEILEVSEVAPRKDSVALEVL